MGSVRGTLGTPELNPAGPTAGHPERPLANCTLAASHQLSSCISDATKPAKVHLDSLPCAGHHVFDIWCAVPRESARTSDIALARTDSCWPDRLVPSRAKSNRVPSSRTAPFGPSQACWHGRSWRTPRISFALTHLFDFVPRSSIGDSL